MRTIQLLAFTLFTVMSSMLAACSSENDLDSENPEQENPIEAKDVSAKDLIGHWQCTIQKWIEAGDEWQSSYDIKKDEYYIEFNEDFTGMLDSGNDQLMEIMNMHTFTWSISKGVISFGTSSTDKWYIKEFSENDMTLYWVDGEYNITCKFKRDAGGTYKPVLGNKIMRITNYYLRNGTAKDNLRYYDFKYDSQNRIEEWTETVTDGNGVKATTKYSYEGNTIKTNYQNYIIGENGYLKIGNRKLSPTIEGENITKLLYDNNGFLTDIEYGEDPLRKGTIHYEYKKNGYFSTLSSFYKKETYQYTYNVEFLNNTSINLVPLYTYGGYFNFTLELFDFVGKRPLFLLRESTYHGKNGSYNKREFIFKKDNKGRVIQIREVTNLSPQVWDIYYENITNEPTDEPTDGYGAIANAVDLGLSVKWASWNLGATGVEEYGGLYTWGVPNAKPGYNTESNRPDYLKEISGTEYDIARAQWGKNWRLPTNAEQAELTAKCKWELTEINNIIGLKVTGPNNRSIFLPAAGYQNSVATVDRGEIGYYWSGTRDRFDAGKAYPIYRFFTTSKLQINWYWFAKNYAAGADDLRFFNAMSIRPVCD